MHGYHGRALLVNLTDRTWQALPIDGRMARMYLGGNGFAASFVHTLVRPGTGAFDPDNCIVFAVGPVTDTPVWGSSRGHVASISPLTGFFFDSNFGGDFAIAQKRTGFDALVLTGAADKPVCLLVTETGVEVLDGTAVWGLDTEQTVRRLQKKHGGRTEVLAIGPAGENRVAFANIMASGKRTGCAGRGGLGAVLGSKNVKAIAASGSARTGIARPDDLKDVLDSKREAMMQSTSRLRTFGTPMLVGMIQGRGLLGTRNNTRETFAGASGLSGELIREKYHRRNTACRGCPVACGKDIRVDSGRFAGSTVKMPEYETIYSLGSMMENGDIMSVSNAAGMCDLMGLDTISMGVTLAFAAECFADGLLDGSRFADPVRFGDGGSLAALVEKTAYRRDIGELLALGSVRMAAHIGRGAEKKIYAVKGMEIAGHSARGQRPLALGYATATRGGSHHDTRPRYLAPDSDPGFEHQPGYAVQSQNATAVGDSMVMCRFTLEQGFGTTINDDWASLVRAVTGWDLDTAELECIGERIYNLERNISVCRGMGRGDDSLPWRVMNEPIPDGPAQGRCCPRTQLDRMLDDYYRIRGWSEDGKPALETVKRLGIE